MEQGDGSWRQWAIHFKYRRPYVDKWGVLHDPTTWWDERLKYYQHHVKLIVSDATRRKARPAWAGAEELIRQEKKRHRRNLERTHELEAQYLDATHRRKQWKRRKRKKRAQERKYRSATRSS